MARATFSLDEATIETIRRTSARLRKPQSHVVREAIAEYAARADRLSDGERARALAILDTLRHARPTRQHDEVDRELAEVRAARRAAGRRRRTS